MIRKIKQWIQWARFGNITSRVKETVNGITAEEEYYDRNGNIVGYWAYGSFDPGMPYKGGDAIDQPQERTK